jgi:integrase
MAIIWHKTKQLGVRYREHATRKNGVGYDRCYSVRYKLNGKDKEEVVGWASQGMTADRASKILSEIKENIRLGNGPQSLSEIRRVNEDVQRLERERAQRIKLEQITFAEFWSETYLPDAETRKAPKSVEAERGLYKKWIQPVIGATPLQKIDVKKVDELTSRALKAGMSDRTVQYIMAVISQVWNQAVIHGLIQGDSPTRRAKKPKINNKRDRFLKPEEARQLLAALKPRSIDTHDQTLLSLFSGLRAGEVHALVWGDIDLESGDIFVRCPKNKRDRHVPMTAEVREMFTRRYSNQPEEALVFPATNGKKRQWVSDLFAKVVNGLGLNKGITDPKKIVVFHTLRHTCASWAVQRGNPLYVVGKLLGHTTHEMTQRYSHLSPESLEKVALSLEGQLEVAPAVEGNN